MTKSGEQRPDPAMLVDIVGAAKILGLKPARVRQLATYDDRFPRPLGVYGLVRIFWVPEVEAFGRIPRPAYVWRRPRKTTDG